MNLQQEKDHHYIFFHVSPLFLQAYTQPNQHHSHRIAKLIKLEKIFLSFFPEFEGWFVDICGDMRNAPCQKVFNYEVNIDKVEEVRPIFTEERCLPVYVFLRECLINPTNDIDELWARHSRSLHRKNVIATI